MKKTRLALTSFVISTLPLSASVYGYEVVEVKKPGTITGKVTFSGDDPAPVKFMVAKDVEVCGKTREVDFVKVNNGALTDVAVYLENVQAGKPYLQEEIQLEIQTDKTVQPAKMASIEQKKCDYGSLLSVIIQGEKLEIINTDSVAHKMHAYEMMGNTKKTIFGISQPPEPNRVVTQEIALKKGVGMKMQCDQHEFMQGFMFVAKNPYYALVAEDGTFTIEEIPAGKYTMKAWHGKLKNHPQVDVSVEAWKTTVVNLDYQK